MFTKLKKSQKPNEGFTIIEVMIVLAIAGLILLIVFLAIPALQRNARNTQRKNDVGLLATGISNFLTNNNGSVPTGAAYAGGQVKLTGPAGTSPSSDIKFGYYTAAPQVAAFAAAPGYGFGQYQHNDFLNNLIHTPKASAAAPAPAAAVGPDNIYIITGATCNGNAIATGNARSYAIMYELEQNGSTATTGGVAQCQGS